MHIAPPRGLQVSRTLATMEAFQPDLKWSLDAAAKSEWAARIGVRLGGPSFEKKEHLCHDNPRKSRMWGEQKGPPWAESKPPREVTRSPDLSRSRMAVFVSSRATVFVQWNASLRNPNTLVAIGHSQLVNIARTRASCHPVGRRAD